MNSAPDAESAIYKTERLLNHYRDCGVVEIYRTFLLLLKADCHVAILLHDDSSVYGGFYMLE